jgi:hypothetical protein
METFFRSSKLGLGLILGGALMLTSCNATKIVNDVQLRGYEQTGDVYGEVTTTVDLQGMTLPPLAFPIVDPNNPSYQVGDFTSSADPANPAQSIVVVKLNLTRLASLKTSGPASLPNGTLLPVQGYAPEDVLQFNPYEQIRVYFSVNTTSQQAMMGVAVPIVQLNGLVGDMGGVNLFRDFSLSNDVSGVAGAFTGNAAGQNGFGLFVDISGLMKDERVQQVMTNNRMEQTQNQTGAPAPMQSLSNSTSSQRQVLEERLIQLSADQVKLKIQ